MTWTITGDDNGTPFTLSMTDRYASNYDIAFESPWEVADLVYFLSAFEGVTVEDVTVDGDVSDDSSTWRVAQVEQRRDGDWVKVNRRTPAVAGAGKPLKVRAVLDGAGDAVRRVPLRLDVPKKAGRRAMLSVEGGAWQWTNYYDAADVDDIEARARRLGPQRRGGRQPLPRGEAPGRPGRRQQRADRQGRHTAASGSRSASADDPVAPEGPGALLPGPRASGSGRCLGERDPEGGAVADPAGEGHGTAVGLHDGVHDVEPEPGARDVTLEGAATPEEAGEDLLELVLVMPIPVSLTSSSISRSCCRRTTVTDPPRSGVLDGVGHQVVEHLAQPQPVDQGDEPVGRVDDQLDARSGRGGLGLLDRLPHQGGEVDLGTVQLEVALTGLGHLEEV